MKDGITFALLNIVFASGLAMCEELYPKCSGCVSNS